MTVTIIGSSHVIKDLSLSLIRRTTDQMESELKHLFEPVVRNLLIARQWGREGILEKTDLVFLNSLFIPVLQENDQVSSMMIADSDGIEYLLLRIEDRWYNRITRVKSWGRQTLWYQWKDTHTFIDTYWKELDYDPRLRPWYQNAVDNKDLGAVNWTEPYTFLTTKDPGITASVSWQVDDTTNVIAFDVLLTDISRFTTGQYMSKSGKSIILTEEGLMLGLSRDETLRSRSDPRESMLSPVVTVESPPLVKAVQNWKKMTKGTQVPFQFKADRKNWWGEFRSFLLGSRTFWIGVVVPASDFLSEVKRQRNFIILITFGALVLTIVMAIFLAQTYSLPLEKLVEQSNRIRNLDLRSDQHITSRFAEVQQLANAQKQMLFALQSFARYVPVEVVRQLLRQGEIARIGGRTENLTVVFTDIRGFTTIAERMSPEELTAHMAEYFDSVLETLHTGRATIDKFMGDGICAFWGAPKYDPDHIENAVNAVLDCRVKLESCNLNWEKRGLPPLPTCFGLDTGSVVVGNVGAHSRLNYTVLGDTVNIASRIEALNRLYGTVALASEKIRDGAGKGFLWRYVDRVGVKGKSESIKIYELLGRRDEVSEETLKFAQCYEEALRLFHSRQFHGALEVLGGGERDWPIDPSIRRLVESCRYYLQHPPPDNWDGIVWLKEK
ncbi:MAG: adenylate/guanylate cyclase domain-containing protein [Candidatus Scalindua sp.]|nr:MAG: adenylate/guanylate cyclase domain-containing protein [Candidatus Scalindua sp.]